MDNPVLVAAFAIYPQMLLILYTPLGLVGSPTSLRRALLPALIMTTVVTLTRSIAFLFGWHVLIFLLTYVLIARLFHLSSLMGALAAVSVSFILVILGDVLVMLPLIALFGMTYEEVMSNTLLYIVSGWAESVFLIIGAALVKWYEFVLIPINRSRFARL